MATLRADGSPRISGFECEFVDGQLRFGSMAGARKEHDLRRDPRFALHGPVAHPVTGQESEWPGEAKIAGRAVVVAVDQGADGADGAHSDGADGAHSDGADGAHSDGADASGTQFVADIAEVVVTSLTADAKRLVVEWWTPTAGLQRVERT